MKSIFLFFIIINGYIFSQELPNLINSKKVTSIAYFEEGDSKSYHFKTLNSAFKDDDDQPESQTITEYDLDLNVLEEADSFYIMEMVYSNFVVQTSQKKKSFDEDFASLQNGLKIRYKTNNLGQFDTILNLNELSLELKSQVDVIKKTLLDNLPKKTSDEDIQQLETILQYVSDRFTTPENVEVLFLSDILTIHGYLGQEFVLDQPIDFEMIYPVFDEFELNGKGTAVLTAINKDSDSFMVNVNSAPSKGELEKCIKDIFESLTVGIKGNKEVVGDFKITSKSKARYSFALSTGWPKLITETTTSVVSMKREKTKTVSKTTVKLN